MKSSATVRRSFTFGNGEHTAEEIPDLDGWRISDASGGCHMANWHELGLIGEVLELKAVLAARSETAPGKLHELIPTNWLDPLLTGPNAVINGGHEYGGSDIERLLSALRERIRKAECAVRTEKAWRDRDIALTEAAHDLLLACDMEEKNEAIAHGKPGKAWSGAFIRRTKLDAMKRIRELTGGTGHG